MISSNGYILADLQNTMLAEIYRGTPFSNVLLLCLKNGFRYGHRQWTDSEGEGALVGRSIRSFLKCPSYHYERSMALQWRNGESNGGEPARHKKI